MRQRLSLDGTWHIAFDDENRGLREDWGREGFPASLVFHPIRVPSVWQERFPEYEGVAWYRRTFVAPAEWQGRRVVLTVGAVNFGATFWINGQCLGSHVGGYTPFSLPAGSALRWNEENEIVARVVDCGVHKEVDGYLLHEIPSAKEIWYHNFSGIYQPVSLDIMSPVYVHDVFAYMRGDHLVVTLALRNALRDPVLCIWRIVLASADTVVADVNGVVPNLKPGIYSITQAIPVAYARRWSPADPHLYDLTVQLSPGSAASDAVTTRVGLRTVGLRSGRFLLNGKPWLPKMVLYQPHYPATLAYPPSDDAVRQEMALIKEAGFDMVRFHIKPPPPVYLDVADEMGLTVYAETALGWIRRSAAIEEHFRREITETIQRDRNHPSIVLWGIINENGRQAATARAMLPLARRLDPSRPVVDNCGLFSLWDGGGWLASSHIQLPHSPRVQAWQDLHIYPRAPVTQDVYDWLNTVGQPGRTTDPTALGYGDPDASQRWLASLPPEGSPIFVSEYGVGALPDLDAVVDAYAPEQQHLPDAQDQRSLRDSLARLMAEHKMTDVYPTIAALAEAEGKNMAEGIRWQTEALRSNPQIAGYGLLQFNDASWEIGAGLVDQWRQPKPAFPAASAANAPLMLAVSGHLRNVRVGDSVTLRCALVNDLRMRRKATFAWRIHDPAGQMTVQAVPGIPIGTECIQPMPEIAFEPRTEGRYSLEAVLLATGKWLCRAEADLFAWDEKRQRRLEHPMYLERVGASGIMPDLQPVPPAPHPAPLPVGEGIWVMVRPSEIAHDDLAAVLEHVRAGDTALFLELWEQDVEGLNQSGLFPFALELRASPSSWLGYLHFAHAHPVFAGLPAPGLLGRQEYNETLARRSLVGMPGECIVVGFSSTGLERARRQEVIPSFWAGSDLQIVPWGKGRLIFSQFLLRETVGRDPVADRLFRNLVFIASPRFTQ